MSWILLRGLAREASHWGEFVEFFRNKVDKEAHTLDLPGAGEFCEETSPSTVEGILEIVRSKAQERGYLHQPVRLFAVSLGAMVAAEWADRYPNEIQQVVLINTSFGRFSYPAQRLRPKALAKLLSLAWLRSDLEKERAILELISNRSEVHHELASQWAELRAARPVLVKNAMKQLIAASRYQGPSQPPQAKCLLINALGDQLVNPICSSHIKRAWGSPLESHPWGGHDLTTDDPDWVIQKVLTQVASFTSFG